MEANAGSKLLIVDDEMDTTQTLRLGLKSRGYKTECAGNGKEAMAIINKHDDIGMVLTDYSMPEMNGVQFLQKLRIAHKHIAVIMMTAYGQKDVIVNALKNNCNGLIEKPFTMDELVAEIERVQHARPASCETASEMTKLVPMHVHQIKNPLTAIMGIAELGVRQAQENKQTIERLTHILKASHKIMRINDEMLNLGKSLKDGKEQIDLTNLTRECTDSFRSTSISDNVKIVDELGESPVFISGNRFGLEQMVTNLLSNAFEAMQETTTEKQLTMSLESADGAIFLRFQDTGCGIPKNKEEDIFEPYYTTKTTGTGLGMEVIKRVAHSHKGSIKIESEPGTGTLFTLIFPQCMNA